MAQSESSKDRYEEVQPIQEFGQDRMEWWSRIQGADRPQHSWNGFDDDDDDRLYFVKSLVSSSHHHENYYHA